MNDRPLDWKWSDMGWGAPTSVPQQMPDNQQREQTLLYGPKGEALIIKKPRPVGFRPERAR